MIGAGASVAIAGLILIAAQLYWNKVKMSSKYVQIEYDKSAYGWVIFIGIAGVGILILDIYLGRLVSVFTGTVLSVGLLTKSFFMAKDMGDFRLITSK